MCWRDNLSPPSIEGIRWANRWSLATMVHKGDLFTFGPDENISNRKVFHRIMKPEDDDIGKTSPDFKTGTRIKFTKGSLKGSVAVLKLSWKRYQTRFQLEEGGYFYPFQKRINSPEPETLEFEILEIPINPRIQKYL